MKKNEKIFVVDLETVSIYSDENISNIIKDEKKYKNTPFLYLITSLTRNLAMDKLASELTYIEKTKIGSWMVYSFQKS